MIAELRDAVEEPVPVCEATKLGVVITPNPGPLICRFAMRTELLVSGLFSAVTLSPPGLIVQIRDAVLGLPPAGFQLIEEVKIPNQSASKVAVFVEAV